MENIYFSKRYKSNFFLILVSVIFFSSLCLCFLIFFETQIVENYLESVIHSEQENPPHYIEFFIATLVLSGISMLFMFFNTLFNLYRAYDEAENLNALANKRMEAIESSREGISILNKHGQFEYMNMAHSVCYGYESPNDLLGKAWTALYSPKEQIFIDNIFKKELVETGWWAGHSVGRKIDGSEFPQEISFTSLEDGGVICVVRDISQYINKENTMQVIKLAIDAATDGIFIIDKSNKFVFVNKSFMTLHALKVEDKNQMVGIDFRSIYKKDEQDIINSKILPMAIIRGFWNGSMNYSRKDGTEFFVDISLTKLPNDLVLGVFRDATERKSLESEREKLKDQMFHAQKVETVTRLIKGISSDFKSSISVIRSNLDLAFANDDIPDERRRYMMDVLNATENANNMIDQLVSLSEGKNVNAGAFDVVDTLLQVNNKMVRTYSNNVKFFIKAKVDSAIIWGDAMQFQNCISSLCLNSVESMSVNMGNVSVVLSDTILDPIESNFISELLVSGKNIDIPRFKTIENKSHIFFGQILSNQTYIRISVSDNGSGIAPDILPNIFDPFFSTKAATTSSGLGLSAIKGIVLAGKGAIVVESSLGQGTSVHLFMPAWGGQAAYAESPVNSKVYN